MRKLYFGSNQKMTRTVKESLDYLNNLAQLTADVDRTNVELFVIPTMPAAALASTQIDQRLITLGAQNMYWEERGQFTGEVSPLALQELGLRMVLVGHSERRQLFGETDETANLRVLSALNHGFTVLLCVGENITEKDSGAGSDVMRRQLKMGLSGVKEDQLDRVMIAYEPVWAIGTAGRPATAEYAQQMHHIIRECLRDIFGNHADEIPVVYGGSANIENANSFLIQPDVDGVFMTRGAWPETTFNSLIRDGVVAARTAGKQV